MKRFLTIVGLLACITVSAQDKIWTLSDCIQYALDNNITIRQSELDVQQKEISLNTEQNRRLPGVSASASENLSFGRGLTEDNIYTRANTTSTSLSLGASVPIFNGFDINNSIKMSKINLAASTANLENAKNDIRIAVAGAYIQILYAKSLLEVAVHQANSDSLQLERLIAMEQVGKANASQVASQQTAYSESLYRVTQAKGNLDIDILNLTQLLELKSPQSFDIAIPNTSAYEIRPLIKPEEIFAEAVETKPEITYEKLMLEYADVNIKKAKGGYMPSLSLSGGLGSNFYTLSGKENTPFGQQIKNNFSQYIGLSLSVPIFSKMSNRNAVKSAKLSFDNQALQLENAKKTLFKEIQQAYYNAVTAQSKYLSSRQTAQSAKISFDLMTEKYENGKANITEYNEAKNSYLTAEANFLSARYECLYDTKLLDFYRGLEIDF